MYIPIISFWILRDEISKRNVKISTGFPELYSTCLDTFNQEKHVYFPRKTVDFIQSLFSEFYWKNIEKLMWSFFTGMPKLYSTRPGNIFWKSIFFWTKNLKFHHCWILKRNWIWFLSIIRQWRHNCTLCVERTFQLKTNLWVNFPLFIVSRVDEKNISTVWWKFYDKVYKAAFYVSRWPFSDKTFFFWYNCFSSSVVDFQG